jgi:hypothetical protein
VVSVGCHQDCLAAVTTFEKKLKYHRCVDITVTENRIKKGKGRPKKEAVLDVVYTVNASLQRNDDEIDKLLGEKGKFIIATNELDESKLPITDLLDSYLL